MPTSKHLRGAENYLQWKANVALLLASKDLEEYITDAYGSPPTDLETQKAWKRNNAKAMLAISLNCTTEPADLISDSTTAYGAWTLLRNQYEGSGYNLKYTYITELHNIDYSQFNSITSFIVRFKRLVSSLAQVNIKLLDDFYIITFINALQNAFLV